MHHALCSPAMILCKVISRNCALYWNEQNSFHTQMMNENDILACTYIIAKIKLSHFQFDNNSVVEVSFGTNLSFFPQITRELWVNVKNVPLKYDTAKKNQYWAWENLEFSSNFVSIFRATKQSGWFCAMNFEFGLLALLHHHWPHKFVKSRIFFRFLCSTVEWSVIKSIFVAIIHTHFMRGEVKSTKSSLVLCKVLKPFETTSVIFVPFWLGCGQMNEHSFKGMCTFAHLAWNGIEID